MCGHPISWNTSTSSRMFKSVSRSLWKDLAFFLTTKGLKSLTCQHWCSEEHGEIWYRYLRTFMSTIKTHYRHLFKPRYRTSRKAWFSSSIYWNQKRAFVVYKQTRSISALQKPGTTCRNMSLTQRISNHFKSTGNTPRWNSFIRDHRAIRRG